MISPVKTNNFFKNRNGFSMIEIIISLSIIIIVFFSLIYSFPFGLKITKSAENSTDAAYLAQEEIEYLFSQGYSNISTGTIEPKHRLSSDPENYLYNFFRQTDVSYVDGDLNDSASDLGMKKISVTVYYQGAISKTEKSYNITTLISQL